MLFSNLLLASVASAAVIGLPLQARQLENASPEIRAHLEARQDKIYHGTMAKKGSYYQADIEIGNPPQKVGVCFDTGSPLLWVPGANSTDCVANQCVSSFDVSKSDSWRYSKPGSAWYGTGYWGWDTVSYAGATLDDFNVYVSNDIIVNKGKSIGVWGQSPSRDTKGSFVQGLAAAGVISRPIYSLNAEYYINYNTKETEGTIANVYYGGYDKKKYQGPLTTINTSGYGAYGIPISGLLVNGEKIKGERDHAVVLDTGGVNFDVTNNTLGAVARANGGGWGVRGWEMKCGTKPTLTYEFGYTTIDLDLSVYMTEDTGNGMCRFHSLRVVPDDKGTLLTGPALISRALVIYDNDRSQITVGRARYTKESEIVEITGDIPGAVLYTDFLAGKPLAGAAPSPKSSSSSSSSAPKSASSVAAAKPSTSVAASKPSTTSKATPQSSSLAVKTTSTFSSPQPSPTQAKASSSARRWCSPFGTFCIYY